MKHGPNWESKRAAFEQMGVGTDDVGITKYWQRNGDIARARGTLLHYHCEQMVNEMLVEEPHSKEFTQARQIYQYLLWQGLTPFRAEVNIFHCGLGVAGQPDLLMRDNMGRIIIVDWKRSKSIRMDSFRDHLKYPLQHIPDSNYWLYSLQINLYGYILETEYDMKVGGYYLAVVHPDLDQPRLISCPRMDDEMRALYAYEKLHVM